MHSHFIGEVKFEPSELDVFNAPVYNAFGNGPLYMASACEPMHTEKLKNDYSCYMLRSLDGLKSKKNNQGWRCQKTVDLFKMADGTFIILAAELGD